MAKKKNNNPKVVVAAETTVVEAEPVEEDAEEENGEYEEDELELLQVDLGDMVKLKQVLDEAVAGVLLEHLEEDYLWDNFKLGIMTAACAFAMVAQFAPLPFPESRPLLGVCGCAYFVLSGVLQFITTFIDEDCILLTKPLENNKTNKLLKDNGVRVRSSLPRFSEWYTVILEFQMKDKTKSPSCVEQRWSVGKFFDKEGYFDEVGLVEEVETLYKRFAQEQYDTSPEEKKNL